MKRFIGTRDVPDGEPGCAYNRGIVWEEQEDGNFKRIDELSGLTTISVEKNTFMEFVRRGWLIEDLDNIGSTFYKQSKLAEELRAVVKQFNYLIEENNKLGSDGLDINLNKKDIFTERMYFPKNTKDRINIKITQIYSNIVEF